MTRNPNVVIQANSLDQIWGVARWHDGAEWTPSVVGLRADRRTIGAHSTAGPKVVAVATSEVTHGALCPTRAQVAWMTADGCVYAFDLTHGAMVREVTP